MKLKEILKNYINKENYRINKEKRKNTIALVINLVKNCVSR